jgi:anti-sigma B factor antagonist
MPLLSDFGVRDEQVDDRTHLVAPAGEIDALTAPQLGATLLGLAEKGRTDLVVDLSRVTFMDSTGIAVLLNTLRSLASRGRSMVLVCPTERILKPFEVTGLVNRLQIARSREEAIGRLDAV